MATPHISASDLSPEVRALIDRLRAGEEIVIDAGDEPVAIIRPVKQVAGRPDRMDSSLGATLARLEAREKELGYPLRMGADYADDLEEIIRNRKPRDTSAWD